MLTPTVSEVARALEPVTADPFIDDAGGSPGVGPYVKATTNVRRWSTRRRRRRAWLGRRVWRQGYAYELPPAEVDG